MQTINANTVVTIHTLKGDFTGTLRDACIWQAQMQGALDHVSVDGEFGADTDRVDYNADTEEDLLDTIDHVCVLLRAAAVR